MPLLPFLLSMGEDLEQSVDDFGVGYYPHRRHYRASPRLGLYAGNVFPRRDNYQNGKDDRVKSAVGKDGFQVCMTVLNFKPNEIIVKTVDNQIIVEGKHEEREDEHGFISRQFTRKYTLPKGYEPTQVTSTLSSDGILTVKAPPPPKSDVNERIVQIHQTGPANLFVKPNQQDEQAPEKQAD